MFWYIWYIHSILCQVGVGVWGCVWCVWGGSGDGVCGWCVCCVWGVWVGGGGVGVSVGGSRVLLEYSNWGILVSLSLCFFRGTFLERIIFISKI